MREAPLRGASLVYGTASPAELDATGDSGLPPGTYTCEVVIDP